METMKAVAVSINMLGLIADMIGVFALFKLRDRGLSTINTLKVRVTPTMGYNSSDINHVVKREVSELTTDLNRIIEATNRTNEKILSRSKKWFLLIIFGFLLQLTSTVLGLL